MKTKLIIATLLSIVVIPAQEPFPRIAWADPYQAMIEYNGYGSLNLIRDQGYYAAQLAQSGLTAVRTGSYEQAHLEALGQEGLEVL